MSYDIIIGNGVPTHREEVGLRFDFDYTMYLAAAPLIKKLCGWTFDIGATIPLPGDALSYRYSFNIGYFGNVERNLHQALTLLSLLDMAVVEVDSDLLDQTTCLLARVVEKLRQIQAMTAPREA